MVRFSMAGFVTAGLVLGGIGAAWGSSLNDSAENDALIELYNRTLSHPAAVPDQRMSAEVKSILAKGLIVTTFDHYRSACILVRSDNCDDLAIAHDMALVSAMSGFRPGLKLAQDCQRKLLSLLGVETFRERPGPIASFPLAEVSKATVSVAATE